MENWLEKNLSKVFYFLKCFYESIWGYKQTHSLEEAKKIVDDIMNNADVDRNGNIEYNGENERYLFLY